MVCYKDITFCSYYRKCLKGFGCFRSLTKAVEKDAIKKGIMVSQFADRPKCFLEKETMK